MRRVRSGDEGTALISAILIVSLCAAVSVSVLAPSLARHRESEQTLDRDEAFGLAESGIDWGLASVRGNGGRIDGDSDESLTVPGSGSVVIAYVRGDGNSRDDDGDGATDEGDEARFTEITSIATVAGTRRGASVIVRGPASAGGTESAILLNVPTPVTAIRGNAFVIDGRDHDAEGAVIVNSAPAPGLGTGGPTADLLSQLPAALHDQILGLGGSPSIAQRPLQDMDVLVAGAMSGGYEELQPGTYPGQNLGLDSPAGVTPVTVCNGDLHLAGNSGGSGTLVVNGDLHISGDFTWTGTLLVRGALKLTGGGKSKRLIGAVIVGDGVEGSAFSADDISSMTPEQIAEVDAENKAAYDAMAAAEKGYYWDEEHSDWREIDWDSNNPEHANHPDHHVGSVESVTEQTWVEKSVFVQTSAVDADVKEGYYVTEGAWVTTLRTGVDPVLELSGNVEILFSRELAETGANAGAALDMSVLAWFEIGVSE